MAQQRHETSGSYGPIVYRPIEPSNALRILLLQPAATLSDSIICNLLHARFNEAPPYEALSYVWGEHTPAGFVQLDGKETQVTPNLESALRYLRLEHHVRYLWVDALCIDQGNLDERSKHVQFMAEIYKRCTMDLLWFGPDGTMIDGALEAIASNGSSLKALNEAFAALEPSRSVGLVESGESVDSFEPMSNIRELDKQYHRHKDMIRRLFRADVWNRVWIVQEVAFAPKVLLVAGRSSVTWEEIERILDVDRYVEQSGIPDAFHQSWGHEASLTEWLKSTLEQAQVFVHQRMVVNGSAELLSREPYRSHKAMAMRSRHRDFRTEESYSSSLLDVLARFRHQKATDPRDKVYALLGLCEDSLDIEADYTRSVRDVYIDSSRRIIDHDGSLDLLCQGPWQLSAHSPSRDVFPSWLPDYLNPGRSRILFAQRGLFCAGPAKLHAPLRISSSGALVTEGWSVGTLAAMRSEETGFRSAVEHAWQSMPDPLLPRYIIKEGSRSPAALLQNEVELYPGSMQPTFEAYWRTLLMDCTRYPIRRLESEDLARLRELFNDWIQDCPQEQRRELDRRASEVLYHTLYTWRFAVTESGLYCMVPPTALAGMQIVALPGAKVPVILESREDGMFKMVGTCYVHGYMDGEAYLHHDDISRQYEIM